eukprot:CAMPEP_0176455000 /NCGR_PEP_ID=MMETSP0127-20121128/30335_1 /TAXON_ID=938130 /ORGANISM="Platyophrya macrostoma, Strain WH" /LENGTH=258 /DNA_ID=CAMNT_0017844491 /DNA_START=35 /DNA_END=811 /DNA_ORIENTATION=+
MTRKTLILALCFFLATSAFGMRMRVSQQQAVMDANAATTNASVPVMKGTEAPKTGVYTYPNGTVIPPEELAKLLSSDNTQVLDKRVNQTEKAEEEAEKTVERAEEQCEKPVEKAEEQCEKTVIPVKTEEEAEKVVEKAEEIAEKPVVNNTLPAKDDSPKIISTNPAQNTQTTTPAQTTSPAQTATPGRTSSPQYMTYPMNLGGNNMWGSPFQMYGNGFPMLNYGFQQPMMNFGYPMYGNGFQNFGNYPLGGLQYRIMY